METLLGLTATAPEGTVRDIARHLGVPEKEGGVIRGKLLPRNLVLSVSKVWQSWSDIVTQLRLCQVSF